MNILITATAGFIGTHGYVQFIKARNDIIGIDDIDYFMRLIQIIN